MAGEWIKMRAELYTHPRFIALSNQLIYGTGVSTGFLTFVCGEDALNIGVMPPSNESVTDRALRLVTKRALREVTMSVLLRVWCAINAHCKVRENDAVCSPMSLLDLDEIAGFDGFGEALEAAGWVVVDESNDALVFKNFREHNEPACLRRKPLSNAERQAQFRERQKAEKEGVTKVTKSNAREEKRREEKNNPLPPSGEFLRFWDSWPASERKQAKGKCWDVWRKASLDGKVFEIVAHVEALKASDGWQRDGGRFVPAPLVYLNQRRWEGAEAAAAPALKVAL